ncbi:MAG: IPT/TIG domain-containing protein [Tepidisphaeraceae bacterium]
MANAIILGAGLSTSTNPTVYTVTVKDPDYIANPSDTTGPLSVAAVKNYGPDPSSSSDPDPEIFVLLDWSSVAGQLGGNGTIFGHVRSTYDVAAAVCAELLQPGFLPGFAPAAVSLPIDLIGHSRGGSLVAGLAADLGESNVWVDQVTTLDPYPVAIFGDYGSFTKNLEPTSNVIFSDNYYQTNASFPDGLPVEGTQQKDLTTIFANDEFPDSSPLWADHLYVHDWYYGTIDTNWSPTEDNITVPRLEWYSASDLTDYGFSISRLGGATWQTWSQDVPAGLSTDFGGSAARYPVTQHDGAQWPDVFLLSSGSQTLTIGQSASFNFEYSDYGKASDVVLFLDPDQNPFNNNFLAGNGQGPDSTTRPYARGWDTLPSVTGAPGSGSITLDTTNAPPGTYFLCVEIKDNDYSRFVYLPGQITLVNPVVPAPTVSAVSPGALYTSSTTRQSLQIFGNNFNANSTLLFTVNNGSPIQSTPSYLHYIGSNEIDYDILTGSNPAGWVVQVVNGSIFSNAVAFNVVSAPTGTTLPIATLSYPSSNGTVPQAGLNSGGVIMVTYSDVGSGFNPASITSSGPKFTLSGSAAAGVTLSSAAPTLATDSTSMYLYKFTGSFGIGPVTLDFPAGTFWDYDGNGNLAETQTFTVTSTGVQTGALQVTISPQNAINAGAQWSVDNGPYQNSGGVVPGLTVGTHTVQFKLLSGWNTPPNQSVTIVAGQTTGDTATYSQSNGPYWLSIFSNYGNVYRNPSASSYTAGTPVTLTAVADTGYHFTGWSGNLSGSQNPVTVTMNSNMTITANYAVGDLTHGSLQVTLTPTNAVASGAKWSIDGGAWLDSGTTVSGLGAGQVEIDFLSLPGFTVSQYEFVNVNGGQTTSVSQAYTPLVQTGNLQVAITPQAAIAAGAQWRVDGGNWLNSSATASGLSVGQHTIGFASVAGWVTPASQTIVVNDNQTTVINEAYSPPSGTPIVSSVSPNTGPLAGGIQVTIQGSDFAGAATVMFGSVAATNVTVNSSTEITATVPGQISYGTVPVSVTVPDGTATDSNGFTYVVPRGTNMQLLGQLGGAVTAVTVQGNYAYIGEGSSLDVINISNPDAPSFVGGIPVPAEIDDIAVSGSFAYVADDDGGLQVVNVGNPSAPSVRGFYDLPDPALDVAVMGNEAYVADGNAGLQIINISNPSAPTLTTTVSTGGTVFQVALRTSGSSTFAYLGDSLKGLQVVDVTTPSDPILRGSLSTASASGGIAIEGTIAYVANGNLQAIDISNPDAPTLLGTYTFYQSFDIAVSGSVVYGCYYTWVNAINVSNPANMTTLATSEGYFGEIYQVAADGSVILMAAQNGLVVASSGSSPMAPVGQYSGPIGFADDVVNVGNTAYVALPQGMQTIDVSNPDEPVLDGNVSLENGNAYNLDVENGFAYVANASLSIVNVSNPDAPILAATYSPSIAGSTFYVVAVKVVGSIAYLAGGNPTTDVPEFQAINISNPNSPTEIGSVTSNGLSGDYFADCVSGNYAYAEDELGTLQVINIANPSSPNIVGTTSTEELAYSIAISADGHYVYIGGEGFIQVFDVSTPSAPTLVSTYTVPNDGYVGGLTVFNGLLYAGAGAGGVLVLDPTDPANLRVVASYATVSAAWGVSVVGNQVYVADSAGGLDVIKLLDYVPPSISISSPTAGSTYATNSGTIGIGGIASDNVGVTQVVWTNDQGGGGIATGTTNWSVSSIVLQSGSNDITVTAMDAAGNESSSVLTVDYTPVQSAQTITFPAPADVTFGDAPFGLNATASSGLPVAFSIVSGPATLQNNVITTTGAGTVVVSASQGGNAFYIAAPTVTQSFAVAQANQTIVPLSLGNVTFGVAPFAVDPAASSGLPVSLSVVSGPATVSNDVITLTGAGSVSLQESQAGSLNYDPASNVDVNFSVLPASQTISFGSLSTQTVGDAPFALNASASSGLPVGFGIVSGPATLSGSVLTVTGVGTVTVQASQAGNADYNAASPIQQSFTVNPAPDVWAGTQSNSWSNPANWSGGQVPTSTTNVVISGGTVLLSSPFTIGNLTVSGGTLRLPLGLGVSTVSNLTIAGTGTLDLGNNELIINYGSNSDPKSAILQSLASGYNGGNWSGPGIDSSAAAISKGAYGVGFADGADGVVQGLSNGQIELKYTLNGDANLDGLVNGADFTILAANFNQSVTGWDHGDFNYDRVVNGADFTDLAANFNQGANLNAPGLVAGSGAIYTITGSPGAQSLDILSGTVTLTSDLSALLPNYSLQIENGASVVLASDQHIGALQLVGSGSLDVSNYTMFINYGSNPDPISAIAGYIKSGYNGGGWNGPGIISTAAQTKTNGLSYGVGYADSADPHNPAGLASGQIEIKYTLLGDANLDGLVNAADFTILAANFNQSVTGWDQGDFNYDGLVNAADFTDLAANFNQGASGAAVASSAPLLAAPATPAVASTASPVTTSTASSIATNTMSPAPAVASATPTVIAVTTLTTAAAPPAPKSKAIGVSKAVISHVTSKRPKALFATSYTASVSTIPSAGSAAAPQNSTNKDAKFLADRL